MKWDGNGPIRIKMDNKMDIRRRLDWYLLISEPMKESANAWEQEFPLEN